MSDRTDGGQGFRRLGDLMPRTLPSPADSGSTPEPSPTSSPTTGTRSLAERVSSSIGMQRGATGAVALSPERAMAMLDPEAVDRALVASLPPSLASICQEVERTWTDPVYGFDYEVTGYSFGAGILDASDDDLRTARNTVAVYMRPPSEVVIKQELARLRASTKSREADNDDVAMGFQVLAEECSEYPADVVVWALRGWAKREVFYPSLAEVRDLLQRGSRRRESLAKSLGV